MTTGEALRCPYCLANLDEVAERIVRCAKCQTPHHGACFAEHTRCTLLGCGETETVSGQGAPALQLASLHPFLPVGEGLVQRTASFLSVREGERDRRKVRGRQRGLTLEAPGSALVGSPLELTLEAYCRGRVRGEGLRLEVRSLLDTGGGRELVLGHQEAVLVGRANRSWRSRFKLWSREAPLVLLLPGLSSFELSFDPTPLAWRGPLPSGAAGGGPRQLLELRAHLDAASGARSLKRKVLLLDGRPAPPDLEIELLLGSDSSVQPLNPLSEPPRWLPHPVTTWSRTEPLVRTTAQIALRHDEHDPHDLPTVDALDLELRALARGAQILRGEVTLLLHRPVLRGRLVLQFAVQRRALRRGKREWRTYARESALLFDGSPEGVDVAGRHVFAFQHVVPPSFFWGRAADPRRVRVRAALIGEGVPLRSPEREARLEGLTREGQ